MTEPLLRSSRHVKPGQPRGCRTRSSAELPWGCPCPPGDTRATLLPARSAVLPGSGSRGIEVPRPPGAPRPLLLPGWALVPGGNGKFPSRGSLTPLHLRRNPTASGQGSMALGGTWSWWHPRGRQGTGGCGAGAALGAPPLLAPQLSLLLAAALGGSGGCCPVPTHTGAAEGSAGAGRAGAGRAIAVVINGCAGGS